MALKNAGKIIAGAAGALTAATAVKAAFFKHEKSEIVDLPEEKVDVLRVQNNLTKAIQIKTVSRDDVDQIDWNEFTKFHDFLEETYPLIHKNMTREHVARASLIYKWEGTNPSLAPIGLLSHQDVVPVTPGTENDWEHPPFSGYNDGEFIWGRGAADMKNHLICVMEAIETLMEEGFRPERDVYLCFGHNEEIVCSEDPGADEIVRILKERGVYFDSVLDEGGALLTVDVPGVVNAYIAGVGTAEKGYCDYKITVTDKGGHTSQAPKHNGLGKLANVIKDLEGHQFDAKMLPFIDGMFENIGKNSTFLGRMLLCNYKYLKPLFKAVMTQIPASACMIRTVTGVSMCSGSPAPNVLPQRATVTANFRPIVGETIADVEKHIRKVVRYKDIEVELIKGKEASSRFASTECAAFKAIDKICKAMYTDRTVVTTPYLVMGGTDSYFYEDICENVVRFSPFKLAVDLLRKTHGTNERCPVDVLPDGVAFFKRYIRIVSKEER